MAGAAEVGNIGRSELVAAGAWHQPQKGTAECRFAGAGFTDDADGLAFLQPDTDAIDSAEDAGF
jgi:hypothetical protein